MTETTIHPVPYGCFVVRQPVECRPFLHGRHTPAMVRRTGPAVLRPRIRVTRTCDSDWLVGCLSECDPETDASPGQAMPPPHSAAAVAVVVVVVLGGIGIGIELELHCIERNTTQSNVSPFQH